MPFAAITYDIKPGFEDEIDEIFANFRRVGSPKIEARRDEPEGKVVATAVFIRDAFLGVFNRSRLRRITQLSVHDLPVAG